MTNQLTTGPVWVKCVEIMPEDTKRPNPPKQVFVKWLHSGEFESKGTMTVNQLTDRLKGNIYDTDFQWLDESNTQQVFTREQVEPLLYALEVIACNSAHPLNEAQAFSWIDTARVIARDEMLKFNLNYPPINK
jgi:hypothetical protein